MRRERDKRKGGIGGCEESRKEMNDKNK